MRRIGWISAFLFLAGWVACETSLGVGAATSPCQSVWRRTRDGWTRQEVVVQRDLPAAPALHPLLLAAFQVLVPASLAATASARTSSA